MYVCGQDESDKCDYKYLLPFVKTCRPRWTDSSSHIVGFLKLPPLAAVADFCSINLNLKDSIFCYSLQT